MNSEKLKIRIEKNRYHENTKGRKHEKEHKLVYNSLYFYFGLGKIYQ